MKATPSPLAGDGCGELAGHRETGGFSAGTMGSLGLTGEPSGPGAGQEATPGPGKQGLCRGQRPVIGQLRNQRPGRPLSWACSLARLTCAWAAGLEKRAQQTPHDEGRLRKFWIKHSHSSAPNNTQEGQGNQSFLQNPGDVALPPLKSSRGDSISCWQNTATQRPKAQRGSDIIPSRTLRIQPLSLLIFCPKHVD